MELILVRHAEPVEEGAQDGTSGDPGLSEHGRIQACAVADWLLREGIDRVVSSPARRARETAAETAARAEIHVAVDDRLRDAAEASERYVPLEVDRVRDDTRYRERVAAYRASPRLASITARVNAALDEWTARARGERLVVFCHGSVVNVYAARVLGLDRPAFLEAGYASGHRFLVSPEGVQSVKSLNETGYLAI